MNSRKWYKVLAAGAQDSAVKRTENEAWESWQKRVVQKFPYAEQDMGTAIAAHSARCVEFATKDEAKRADISCY